MLRRVFAVCVYELFCVKFKCVCEWINEMCRLEKIIYVLLKKKKKKKVCEILINTIQI